MAWRAAIPSNGGDRVASIGHHICPDDIALDVEVADKAALLAIIGRHMEEVHKLSHDTVSRGLARREALGSTAVGQGVAIPHTRVNDIDRLLVAYYRLKPAIDFGAPDALPVRDVLVILAPKQADETHLVILADAAQLFSDRAFRERLHQCRCRQEIVSLFQDPDGGE